MALPKVIDFYADWCGPCKMQTPILDKLEPTYEGKVEFEKINVDEKNELAQKYGIRSIPTLVILNAEGEEIKRFVGLTDAKTLSGVLDQFKE